MRNADIVTLYKNKGDRSDCNNYRGISLVGKAFALVVLNRLQLLAERVYPERRSLYITLIDLTKAFDLVSRNGRFTLLQKIGCPSKLLRMITSFHEDMQGTVQYDGSSSDPFPIKSGVLFADDAALTTHSEEALQPLNNCFPHACREFGLTISLKKTNILGQDVSSTPSIIIGDYTLEVVQDFTYLGSTISSNLSLDAELDKRIGKAATATACLAKRV
ncbi:uncharacterized protein LOC119580695 [Penaeus monodon]|uniref:uncharacterized protein LOC119580695 n=1 Tax=Penaeus monodon TaxID=6687 RepID=UPI0018A7D2D4|nr:uncharacterized protein LOC119580695 [Penaeus monodon]